LDVTHEITKNITGFTESKKGDFTKKNASSFTGLPLMFLLLESL